MNKLLKKLDILDILLKLFFLVFMMLFSFFLISTITSNATTYIVTTEDNTKVQFDIDYVPSQAEIDRLNNRLHQWYQCNKNIRNERYIIKARDYIAKKMSYDYECDITGWRAYTPYTLLDTKKSVCMGYTQLMQILLDKKGIVNKLVYDMKEVHIWNKILVDGKWIDIDVTTFDNGGYLDG